MSERIVVFAAEEVALQLRDSPEKDFTMKRFAILLACTLMISSSGCCLFGRPCWGGGGCSPCGYGAGYTPNYGGYAPAGGCPNGQCGTYPGAYVGGAPTAAVPYGYPQHAMLDPMPVY